MIQREPSAVNAPHASDLPSRSAGASSSSRSRRKSTPAAFRSSEQSARRWTSPADIFADGHEVVVAMLRDRSLSGFGIRDSGFGGGHIPNPESQIPSDWRETPMTLVAPGTDRWAARFDVNEIGWHEYQIVAWVDRFLTWRRDLAAKTGDGQDVSVELLEGSLIVREAAARAEQIGTGRADAQWLLEQCDALSDSTQTADRVAAALNDELAAVIAVYADRSRATTSPTRRVWVDRERARFGAWYEMFPRSAGPDPSRSATFREAAAPTVAHRRSRIRCRVSAADSSNRRQLPQGAEQRAGRVARAIPAAPGRSDRRPAAIPPSTLVSARWRISRCSAARRSASASKLRSISRGSARRIIRGCASTPSGSAIAPTARSSTRRTRRRSTRTSTRSTSNATTGARSGRRCSRSRASGSSAASGFSASTTRTRRPFGFWEWMIGEVTRAHPGRRSSSSEAFTRPKLMRYLAKAGFTQSYTYFTWRNTKAELTEYFTELTAGDVARHPPAESLREHARHPARVPAAGRPAGVRGAARCWPRRSARATVSTADSNCAKAARSRPAARSTRTPRNISTARWDWDGRGQHRRARARASTTSGIDIPRCSVIARCSSATTDNDQIIAYTKNAQRTDPTACSPS